MTQLQRDNLEPLIHEGAELSAKYMKETYEKYLGFEDVQISKDLTKEQVLNKLGVLMNIAKNF